MLLAAIEAPIDEHANHHLAWYVKNQSGAWRLTRARCPEPLPETP